MIKVTFQRVRTDSGIFAHALNEGNVLRVTKDEIKEKHIQQCFMLHLPLLETAPTLSQHHQCFALGANLIWVDGGFPQQNTYFGGSVKPFSMDSSASL